MQIILVDRDSRSLLSSPEISLAETLVARNTVPVVWGKMQGAGPDMMHNGVHQESFSVFAQYQLSNRRAKIVSVGCGQNHQALVNENGELFTWGDNKYG